MTFYIITTLFHREMGKNKKRRRQSRKEKKKSTPTTSSNKSLCSYLLSNGLSIETYFMWQALLLFFFLILFFGTSGTNRGTRARPCSSVLNHCHPQITRHHPLFSVCVCLFFVNAISIKSLLNSFFFNFFFLLGGVESQGSASPAGLWHRGSPRYPPRKLIQSIKNLESGAFLHVFVH